MSEITLNNILAARQTLKDFSQQVEILYKEWQLLKLEVLGYAWGPADGYKPMSELIDHFYFDNWNKDHVRINYCRGGDVSLPTRWVFDPNWKDEARKIFEEQRNKELLKKFES